MESFKEFWDDYKEVIFTLGGILLVVLAYKLFTIGMAYIDTIGK